MPVSPATQHDIPALHALINTAYRGEEARQGWTHEADLISGDSRIDESSLADILRQSHSTILKYVDEQRQLTGCVYLEKQENKLYLGMLSVHPRSQAGGIGKRLLKAAEEYALLHHFSSIIMTVISTRNELIAWYERHGYVNTGLTKPFPKEEKFGIPRQPLVFVVLEKKL